MRHPEANVEVYALGHYEQMHLELALEYALQAAAQRPRDTPEPEEAPFNALTVRGLLKVFASHGTVTILRRNDG